MEIQTITTTEVTHFLIDEETLPAALDNETCPSTVVIPPWNWVAAASILGVVPVPAMVRRIKDFIIYEDDSLLPFVTAKAAAVPFFAITLEEHEDDFQTGALLQAFSSNSGFKIADSSKEHMSEDLAEYIKDHPPSLEMSDFCQVITTHELFRLSILNNSRLEFPKVCKLTKINTLADAEDLVVIAVSSAKHSLAISKLPLVPKELQTIWETHAEQLLGKKPRKVKANGNY